MSPGQSKGLVVQWTIIAFLAGALWGAELAVSIVFTVLMPRSLWALGIFAPPSVALILSPVLFP